MVTLVYFIFCFLFQFSDCLIMFDWSNIMCLLLKCYLYLTIVFLLEVSKIFNDFYLFRKSEILCYCCSGKAYLSFKFSFQYFIYQCNVVCSLIFVKLAMFKLHFFIFLFQWIIYLNINIDNDINTFYDIYVTLMHTKLCLNVFCTYRTKLYSQGGFIKN